MPETDVIIARTNAIILSEFARPTAISYLSVVVVVVVVFLFVLFCFAFCRLHFLNLFPLDIQSIYQE